MAAEKIRWKSTLYDSLQLSTEDVAQYIEKGKSIMKKEGLSIPVDTAEAWHILAFDPASNVIANASNFLCMNMQPYWGGLSATCGSENNCPNTGEFVESKAEVIASLYNKTVVICNTGWPTEGELCCGQDRPGSLDGFQVQPSIWAIKYTNTALVTQ